MKKIKKLISKNKDVKKDMNHNKKAQVSIEMIVILGILILGAVILATFLGLFGEKTTQLTDLNEVAEGTFDGFLNNLGNSSDGSFPQQPGGTGINYTLTLIPNNASFGTANTSGSYQSGSLVTVTATPSAGYSFVNWTITSTGVVASTNASYSFTMPTNNLGLTANFSSKAPTLYTLSLVENPNEPNATLIGAGSYAAGTVVSVSITTTGSIFFNNWTNQGGTVVSSVANFNYTMPASNTTLTANFSTAATMVSYFTSTWDTTKTSPGSSNSNQIKLPLVPTGTYNFVVYWGDRTTNTITTWNSSNATHTYSSPGEYTIYISGVINGFSFNNSGDKLKLLRIGSWGQLNLGNTGGYFYGAQNLEIDAADSLDLRGTTNLSSMFRDCSSITTIPSLNKWDVTYVTDMSSMFSYATSFNAPLNTWDVRNVTNMSGMFNGATSFNQYINDWDTSNVSDMQYMFLGAEKFNQPLNQWNVSNVRNMAGMFASAQNFDQPLNSWDVSKVTLMEGMFGNAYSFDQPLDRWDISNVIFMDYFFGDITLSTKNYDAILNSWANQKLKQNVVFDAGYSKYSSSGEAARDVLIKNYNWTIKDGGLQ